ncbi:MAG TPA: hypothetical protein ENO23_00485, partial [Alphaproteobacteria bacterium]|nr:hypothetical protein [Alphaproteobacteria bacterium]
MKRLSTILIVLCILSPAGLLADAFSDEGLEPVVVIVDSGDGGIIDRVRSILDREGAGLQFFPPSAFLLHAGAGLESALAGFPARVERDPLGLAGADLDPITVRALAGRLAPPAAAEPLEMDPDYVRRMLTGDIIRHDPGELSRYAPKEQGPNRVSAREIATRAPN